MNSFANRDGAVVVREMIRVIGENRAYLSEIDGAIGDGDHGVNMDKGFSLCLSRVDWETADFTTAMKTLSRILLMEIGGSMGPIYGTFFDQIAKGAKDRERIDGSAFSAMLGFAASEIEKLGGAVRGDKTLLDSLLPAAESFNAAFEETGDFAEALTALQAAAEEGRESTRDMVARVGRASRLGERSRGVLDAGATSCCLLLNSMAESVKKLLKEE